MVPSLFVHFSSTLTARLQAPLLFHNTKKVTMLVTVRAHQEGLLVACLQLGSQLHCSPGTFPNFFLQFIM